MSSSNRDIIYKLYTGYYNNELVIVNVDIFLPYSYTGHGEEKEKRGRGWISHSSPASLQRLDKR